MAINTSKTQQLNNIVSQYGGSYKAHGLALEHETKVSLPVYYNNHNTVNKELKFVVKTMYYCTKIIV